MSLDNDGPAPDVFFVLTSDGRLGIGHTPDKEAGGTHIFQWCPDSLIKAVVQKYMEDHFAEKP